MNTPNKTLQEKSPFKHTILFVDDEIDNLDALERIFRKNYFVLKASSGQEALKILNSNSNIAVIICDQRMPEMTGVEVLEQSQSTHPDTTRILLTGYTDIESVISAVNQGHIFRYITKPWDPIDLSNSITQAIEKYELIKTIKIKNIELEKANVELKKLDEAKTKFMILINHELKTPLTVIINYLDLIKEQLNNQDLLALIEKPILSADRLKGVVDNSLLIMKFKTNQLETSTQNFDFIKTIQEVLSLIQVKNHIEIQKKSLTFKTHFENKLDHPFQISFNLIYFKKIVEELVKNSIQHSIADSEIHVSATENNENENQNSSLKSVRFVISNKGTAISKNVIDNLSEPFKLPTQIMNHSKGIGLGLSVCESLLNQGGSKLVVENISTTSPDEIRISFVLPQL